LDKNPWSAKDYELAKESRAHREVTKLATRLASANTELQPKLEPVLREIHSMIPLLEDLGRISQRLRKRLEQLAKK
jgi:hypothetical protein